MTEAEWLSCIEPEKMLDFLCYDLFPKKVDGRKEYLMSAACCRLIWPLIRDERSRRAIVEAEVMADHPDLPELPGDVVSEAQAAYIESCHKEGEDERPAYAAFKASFKSPHAAAKMALSAAHGSDSSYEGATLIRDIFGNPFRPIAVNPSWLTSDVRTLAEGIYEDRAFDRLPILADALQDVGCNNEDILNHCRGSGPHVRGCWVIDLLLGKE